MAGLEKKMKMKKKKEIESTNKPRDRGAELSPMSLGCLLLGRISKVHHSDSYLLRLYNALGFCFGFTFFLSNTEKWFMDFDPDSRFQKTINRRRVFGVR